MKATVGDGMDEVRELVLDILAKADNGLPAGGSIGVDDNLFGLGMTSFQAVQLMMAIEARFDIQYPDHLITKESFVTIARIRACIDEIAASGEAAA